MTLFSYCIPFDNGSAPNPYWGICTLTICKPVIRRVAEVGDWIIGTGSKNSPDGDFSSKVIYIMEVTKKMSFRKYEKFCKKNYPKKIPNLKSKNFRVRRGDCIYTYNKKRKVTQLDSVHDESNMDTDLSGKYSLISYNYLYFGKNAIEIPTEFKSLIKEGQGFKSKANDDLIPEFLSWYNKLKEKYPKVYGKPQLYNSNDEEKEYKKCPIIRRKCAKKDEKNLLILLKNN